MTIRVFAISMQAGLLLSLCVACAMSHPLMIDFSEATARKPLPRIEGCVVHIAPVMDERTSKEDLGMFQWQVVGGRQVLSWLQQAVASLNAPGLEMVARTNDRATMRALTVHVGLRQLYVHHPVQNAFAATILLHAQYQVDQEPPHSQLYRGADTKVNWTGSAGSIRTLFDDVLDDVVRRMHADIQQYCQGAQARSGT